MKTEPAIRLKTVARPLDVCPYLSYIATHITTVVQQNLKMGKIAVRLLIKQMTTKESFENHSVILPTTLILQKSVQTQVNNYQDQCAKVIKSNEFATKNSARFVNRLFC